MVRTSQESYTGITKRRTRDEAESSQDEPGVRLSLCAPLSRLKQELTTFSNQAILDTLQTVNRMEKARTEYRGALLWMKDVSQELDPDTCKQMDKFRKVQLEVRDMKSHFDKTKMDVCQKVDLLGASRCNLLSHSLASYQTTLLHFWKKMTHQMSVIQEDFQAMLPYTPSYVKPTTQCPEQDNSEKETDGDDPLLDRHMLLNLQEKSSNQQEPNNMPKHLLLDDTEAEDFSHDLMFLSLQPDVSLDFTQEEHGIFVCNESQEANPWAKQSESMPGFLPSHLLDLHFQSSAGSSNLTAPGLSKDGSNSDTQNCSLEKSPGLRTESLNRGSTDMSAWLNLFADLDPLASRGATNHSDNELSNA